MPRRRATAPTSARPAWCGRPSSPRARWTRDPRNRTVCDLDCTRPTIRPAYRPFLRSRPRSLRRESDFKPFGLAERARAAGAEAAHLAVELVTLVALEVVERVAAGLGLALLQAGHLGRGRAAPL